jgi:hypothetical protein
VNTRILLVPGALLLLAGVITARPQQSAAPPGAPAQRWYKGNTHTHTLNSDGDSTPDEVVRWYREHGYQFLVLTDHNYLTSVDGLNALHGAAEKFLVVRGEEVTSTVNAKAVHVNGLNVSSLVAAPSGTNLVEVMQESVDRIRKADGVPHVNHPNFTWAMTAEELGQVQRNRLFEIFNGHPQVNNVGGGGTPGLEEVWDRILSSGRLMYGVAVDDAHHFKRPGDPLASGPGRGWIYVRTDRLEPRAIVEALERGSFYASTGVELADVQATASAITVTIKPTTYSRYRVQFIGRNGRVLSEVTTPAATYAIKGDEGYVRVKVLESNGYAAWTQPVPVGPGGPKISE